MHSIILRAGRIFALMALMSVSGGHWVVLQSLAWGGMLVVNARASGFGDAVEKTFDGEHPCGLCKRIEHGRKSEKKPDAASPAAGKLEFIQQRPVFVLIRAPEPGAKFFPWTHALSSRAEPPLLRPPRIA